MTETTQGKQFLTVAKVFFLLIVIPLFLIALLIGKGIVQLGDTAKQRAVTVLDQKSQEEIKLRAINVADEVADFLNERGKDVLIATILPTTDTAYKEFISKNKQALWIKKEGKVLKALEPLYTEMSLIDKAGNEIIKIVGGEIVPKGELLNVSISDPANTTYKSEDYFLKTMNLSKGDVFMSHVTGWYVNRAAFEKGKRFSGIIRLATPLFNQQGFSGIVTLALDVRHLAKFTDNIIPTETGHVIEADASTGNYAYMVDNRGFIISHPDDYHIAGLYNDGTPVSPVTEKSLDAMAKKGEGVLNLNLLGFMDPALPEVTRDAATGNAGSKVYKFEGHTKFVAYAPIPYFGTSYPEPAGFGWVGMGVDVEKFNEMALQTSKKIEKEASTWVSTIIVIIVIAIILLFLIAAIISRGVSRSIEAEIPPEATKPHFYSDEEK
ncbi:MAG: cache domain-containing protein [Deltaproteobacteria bacterium]|nr:cache domain-containing protein [Deltaproteobacteria bacterium]